MNGDKDIDDSSHSYTRRAFSPTQNNDHTSHLSDDDEPECRVCRGPAEEGRPLYRPCKCAGSIALTHQDCLQSWLEVKGGSDKCDLCSTKFQFAPKYAEDAPERLSTMEVFTGLALRAAFNWIPYACRILLVLGVWLGALPLITAYLYQGWMHRPLSIKKRFHLELVPRDLVSGGILTVIIIISFLSLMSLLDFFRVKWMREAARVDGRIGLNRERDDAVDIAPIQIGEKEDVLHHFDSKQESLKDMLNAETVLVEKMVKKHEKNRVVDFDARRNDYLNKKTLQDYGTDPSANVNRGTDRAYSDDEDDDSDYEDDDGHGESEDYTDDEYEYDDDSMFQRMMRLQEMGNDDDDDEDDEDEDFMNHGLPNAPNEAERLNRQQEPLLRPFDDENGMDVDMQMPIQQLIGLRGPISDLFRNLAWLLAFQTTFIGVFLCIPRYVGSISFHHLIFRSKIISSYVHFIFKHIIFAAFDVRSIDDSPMDLRKVADIMTDANEKDNTLFQPRDVGHIVFGYIFMSALTFLLQGILTFYRKSDPAMSQIESDIDANFDRNGVDHNAEGIRMGIPGGVNPNHNFGRDHRDRLENLDVRPEEMKAVIADFFAIAIEITSAASKISFLVCFKMFVLPFLLGSWLDLSTLQLFDAHIEDRLVFAGSDIIGFFLLHWVVGITFMLTVTVSVLQLREVFHPDLLAPVIRPQEPQPDLLVNLLEDSWWTHTKRMVPSLGIYAAILAIHVWLPCRLIQFTNMQEYIPLFRPQFWYPIYAPLQRPIELVVFHLSILSLLEKNKNCLGEIQFAFLSKILKMLGLLECFLPRNVFAWAYVGDKNLYVNGKLPGSKTDVDHFWKELVMLHKKGLDTDTYVESNISDITVSYKTRLISQKLGLQRKFIILSPGDTQNEGFKLLPARIGSYCFQKKICHDGRIAIELWKECVGAPIARPPKGWDYLADGGAAEQGRWAWGQREKMSDIEQRVAARKHLIPLAQPRPKTMLSHLWHLVKKGIPVITKMTIIAATSWLSVTIVTSAAVFLPIIVGRFMLQTLEIPKSHVHDPFVLVLGCVVLTPAFRYLYECVCGSESNRYLNKRKTFFPPFQKSIVLIEVVVMWFFLCPLIVGYLYHQLFFGFTPQFFQQLSLGQLLKKFWPSGLLLTHLWAAACYFGVFESEFWIRIRQIAVDGIAGAAPPDRNNNPRQEQVQRRDVDRQDDDGSETAPTPSSSRSWQGVDGNVGRFARSLYSIIARQEWDKIDRVLLIDDFLTPFFLCIATICIAPVAFQLFTPKMSSFVTEEPGQRNISKGLILCSILFQTTKAFRDALALWYDAAHKTARDHRYLVGVVLQNYES